MLLARLYSADKSRRKSIGPIVRIALASAAMAAIMTSPGFAASTPPVDPSGYWSTKDDESIIRIGPCTTPAATSTPATPPVYCGTIVWLKEPLEKGVPKVDDLNPDLSKRGKPVIGMEVFSQFVPDSDHWKGKAYNADDGKTWDVTFKVRPDPVKGDKGEITGCLVWPLCQSETFTKVQTVPGGDPTLANVSAAHGAAPKTPPTAPPPAHPH
jgi:uncharacterized protein (DUF2147 family)